VIAKIGRSLTKAKHAERPGLQVVLGMNREIEEMHTEVEIDERINRARESHDGA